MVGVGGDISIHIADSLPCTAETTHCKATKAHVYTYVCVCVCVCMATHTASLGDFKG